MANDRLVLVAATDFDHPMNDGCQQKLPIRGQDRVILAIRTI
ncbi:hypothetical protein ACKU27_15990 [Sphingobium yanoikuyae]